MSANYQILLPLLSLFWVRVDLTDLFALELPVEIVEVMDGDTLRVSYKNRIWRVRLSKIDAPELKQKFHNSEISAGVFSRQCLKQLIKKRGVLKIEGMDQYRRILGDVDGLSLKAVQNGCTGLYPYANFSSKREKFQYLRAYQKARQLRIGVWEKGGYLLPKKWRSLNRQIGYQRLHQ